MTAISMRQRTFWLWDSQLLPVERWSDLDGRKLAQAHLREAGKPTREGGNPAWGAGNPLGLPRGRMSTKQGWDRLATNRPFGRSTRATSWMAPAAFSISMRAILQTTRSNAPSSSIQRWAA